MREAFDPATDLAADLDERIDGWSLAEGGCGRRIEDMAALLDAAGLLARGVAERLLPAQRVGLLVTGYRGRHGLYRLVRARLAEAALGGPDSGLGELLLDDVLGLLLAGRFEAALLTRAPHIQAGSGAHRILAHCLELYGPEVRVDDAGRHLLGLLTPAVSVPVVHVGQLTPALLAWQLSASGRLQQAVTEVSHILTIDGRGSGL